MDIFSRKKLIAAIIIVLIALNIVTITSFWIREFHRPKPFQSEFKNDRPPKDRDHLLQTELNFDPEQIERYRTVKQRFFATVEPERSKIHQLHTEIMKEAFETSPDLALRDAKVKEVGESEARLVAALFDHIQDLKSITRDDQREKLENLFSDVFRRSRPPAPRDGMPPPPKSPSGSGPKGEFN